MRAHEKRYPVRFSPIFANFLGISPALGCGIYHAPYVILGSLSLYTESATEMAVLSWPRDPAKRQERLLLTKIDCFILSYCCLMVRWSMLGPHVLAS